MRTFVEELAGVGWHRFNPRGSALRAGNRRFKKEIHRVSRSTVYLPRTGKDIFA